MGPLYSRGIFPAGGENLSTLVRQEGSWGRSDTRSTALSARSRGSVQSVHAKTQHRSLTVRSYITMFALTMSATAKCRTVTSCSASGGKGDGGFPLFPLTFLKRHLERQISHKEAGSSTHKGISGKNFTSARNLGSHAGKPFSSSSQDSVQWPRGARNANNHVDEGFEHYHEATIEGDEVSQSLLASLVEVRSTNQTAAWCRCSLSRFGVLSALG
eukprot:153437-Pyramimonas_sp.AAC.1